ncbi:MAG: ABC transporter ATP-binding protein, partial [Candidatus Paceibacterota bacterium]
ESADRICVINHGNIVAHGSPSDIKRELVDEYILMDATQRDKLKTELKTKNIFFSGSGPYKIPLKKHTAQQIIKMINTKLTHLTIHTPTLEEAYLEIINTSNSENNKRA